MDLLNKKCVPCESGTKPLGGKTLGAYLPGLNSDWQVTDGEKKIKREFKFADFKTALAFVNQVGELAEAEGHHPDIYLYYGRVVIELSTHNIGGLSENDFIMAVKIDNLK